MFDNEGLIGVVWKRHRLEIVLTSFVNETIKNRFRINKERVTKVSKQIEELIALPTN